MNAETRKTLAISLIANDLINSRLVYGLRALDIDAEIYSLFLEIPILELIGFSGDERTEELHDLYAELVRKTAHNIKTGAGDYKAMEKLAIGIYEDMSDQLPVDSIVI